MTVKSCSSLAPGKQNLFCAKQTALRVSIRWKVRMGLCYHTEGAVQRPTPSAPIWM